MKRFHQLLFLNALIMIIAIGCNSSSSTSKINFAYKYNPEPSIIRPDFKVFHLTTDLSNLYFSIHSKEILYTKISGDTNYEADLKIRYKLYNQNDLKTLLDSATFDMRDTTSQGHFDKTLLGGVTLNTPLNNNYFIEIRIRDVNRDLNIVEFVNFKKTEAINNGHFILLDSNQLPLLNDRVSENELFYMVKSPLLNGDIFNLNFYSSPFGMAPPPFSENGINYDLPEPIFSDQLVFLSDTLTLSNKQQGFYTVSENNKVGNYCFLSVDDEYPILGDVAQLIPPTRFISTQKEFDKLLASSNIKDGVDEFWLNITKDFNRAKQILGTYYGRVESSNRYFTDVQDGWRTDRGLIYLIYGAPSTIYKGYNYEKWIYGEESNMLAISFSFKRIETAISTNSYILERNNTYKSSWYRAVDNWRQGRVY